MKENDELLDRAGVAALLGIAPKGSLMFELRNDPRFPRPCYLGRLPRWFKSEVLDFVRKQRERQLLGGKQ